MNQDHYNKLMEGMDAWNEWRNKNPGLRPDLSNANLQTMDLHGINLMMANLEKSNLKDANLQKSNLNGANISHVIMCQTNLSFSSLVLTHLKYSNLEKSVLKKVDLSGATFNGVQLIEADISGANLSGAKFNNSIVTGIKYKKLGKCRGIDLNGCHGSPRFIRDAKDNEFVEEFGENHLFLKSIWAVSSDCGRSMLRWVSWSILFALYFAYNFYLMGPDHFFIRSPSNMAPLPFDELTTIYYSVATFTTLGFGDVLPITRTATLWVMAEVIVGYIMLGGLISIMATKLARRAA